MTAGKRTPKQRATQTVLQPLTYLKPLCRGLGIREAFYCKGHKEHGQPHGNQGGHRSESLGKEGRRW